jgi:predicted phage terminase large subunit-like protein
MASRVRFWDLAASPVGDWTAGVRMAKDGGLYTVEDLVRGRWRPHERDEVIRQTAALDGRAVRIVIEQEPGSAGLSQVEDLIVKLAGYTVEGKRSTGDKFTRAAPFASQAQAGNVRLVAGPWNAAFLDELAAFPTEGVNDDIVDAASGAFLALCSVPDDPIAGLILTGRTRGW